MLTQYSYASIHYEQKKMQVDPVGEQMSSTEKLSYADFTEMQADESVNFQKEPVKGRAILVEESPGIQKEVRRS